MAAERCGCYSNESRPGCSLTIIAKRCKHWNCGTKEAIMMIDKHVSILCHILEKGQWLHQSRWSDKT